MYASSKYIHKKIKTDLKKQYMLQSYQNYYVLVGKQPRGLWSDFCNSTVVSDWYDIIMISFFM